ncbi:biotin synthase BioB [Methanocaldococcus fervens]|uniref:Biotin synthase n=1 Tax=Methanocaldococcus fervens (strain DSM 4213 / JCM 15782 / AG86) TaxID=573064 RepID=C7P5F1_METFA|nr:biotin synthase BioB [Methanocaldococcus fervens]ACV25329.1 biotin synthase [Methanocaldococcus fervens AG86]
MEIETFLEKSLKNKITFDDALYLYNNFNAIDLLYLAFKVKNEINNKNNTKNIKLCAIINAKSGKCPEDCIFCSQSIYSSCNIPTYLLKSKKEILDCAKKFDGIVERFSIVTSGKNINNDEFTEIIEAIELIKEETTLKVCCSLGLLDREKLKELKKLNVRIHNNLETSKDYFKNICSTHSYEDKIKVIKEAKKIGLEVCSGGIFGLGESLEERLKLAFELRDLGVDSVPINILHPIEGTKIYEKIKNGEIEPLTISDISKSIALYKIILPYAEIRLAGGRLHNLRDFQPFALMALDGLMVGNYLTTKGRSLEDDLKMLRDFYNLVK